MADSAAAQIPMMRELKVCCEQVARALGLAAAQIPMMRELKAAFTLAHTLTRNLLQPKSL